MTEPLPDMSETQLEAPKSLRYTCPYPGCARSFRDFWRLKVHYRAPPNARGSGVERGHGMELPFCPLCNIDLRDVKYHKCAAGPAAAAPARSRNNQAGSTRPRAVPNSMGPFSMMMQCNGMMPFSGIPGVPGHYTTAAAAQGPQSMLQPYPGMQQQPQQQQQQQQMMALPGLPLMNSSSGGNRHTLQQQAQGLSTEGNPGAVPNSSSGVPQMQPSAVMELLQQQRGSQWWPQCSAGMTPGPPPLQLLNWRQQQQQPMQQQQQQMMLQQHHCAQQQQQLQQLEQQQQQQSVLGASSGGTPTAAAAAAAAREALPGVHRPAPVVASQYLDSSTASWHQPWQQQQQEQQCVHRTQQLTTNMQLGANTSFTYTGGLCQPQQQQQQQQQAGQQPSIAQGMQGCSTTSSNHNNSSWTTQLDAAAAAAAVARSVPSLDAAAAGSGSDVPANGRQLSNASTATGLQLSNSLRTDSEAAAQAASDQLPQQQQQDGTLPAAAASTEPAELAVPLALQELPPFALKIVDEFRTKLEALRSSMSGCTLADNGQQQQQRGNGSSCSNSPVSSSVAAAIGLPLQLLQPRSSTQLVSPSAAAAAGCGAAATGSGDLDVGSTRAGSKRLLDNANTDAAAGSYQPAKRRASSPVQTGALTLGLALVAAASPAAAAAVEQLERPGSGCLERQGSHRPLSALHLRAVPDTPPPTEAQEALLQLAARAESEAANVHAAAAQPDSSATAGAAAAARPDSSATAGAAAAAQPDSSATAGAAAAAQSNSSATAGAAAAAQPDSSATAGAAAAAQPDSSATAGAAAAARPDSSATAGAAAAGGSVAGSAAGGAAAAAGGVAGGASATGGAAAAVVGEAGSAAFHPSDLHTSQVSDLLGSALEAANECLQDPSPVVQRLLVVLNEHVSLVMAGQHGSQPLPAAAAAAAAADPAADAVTDEVADEAVVRLPGGIDIAAAAAAVKLGDGSAGVGPVDVVFEAAIAAVQRDCSALHVEASGHEQQQQQLPSGVQCRLAAPGLTDAAAAAAVPVAATAVAALPDAVMTVAGALGDADEVAVCCSGA